MPEVLSGSGPEPDDGAPTWPDDAAESSYLAESAGRGEEVQLARPETDEEEDNPKSLPSLEELVERIPPQVRATLEDLFRARFTKVRRIPRRALKG